MNLFAPPARSIWTWTSDDAPQTQPPGLRAWNGAPPIACADRQRRQGRAAVSAGPPGSGRSDAGRRGGNRARALELARANPYCVALVDFGLPDVNGWNSLTELTFGAQPADHPSDHHQDPTIARGEHCGLAGAPPAVMLSNRPTGQPSKSAGEGRTPPRRAVRIAAGPQSQLTAGHVRYPGLRPAGAPAATARHAAVPPATRRKAQRKSIRANPSRC